MRMLVYTALATRQPVSEVMAWEPQVLATVHEWLDEKERAEKEAAKGR